MKHTAGSTMNYVAQAHHTQQAQPTRRTAKARTEGHDLPVLAASEDLPRAPGWPALMASGVEPAVFLGAERRLSGNR